MKHCLVLAPLLIASASGFTSVNQNFHRFVQSESSLKVADYNFHGNNDRIEEAYKSWCRVYNKSDTSRLEIFAYHFLLAEKFFGQTGAPIKLNEFADLTASEYLAMQEQGSLPEAVKPTEYVVSETKVSEYAMPEPVAPAGYGPSYLDALSRGSTTISGPGMTSYLDSVPQNSAVGGGAGMTSYLDSMASASAGSPFETYTAPAPAAASVFTLPAPAAPVAPSGANYMDNLNGSTSSSSAPTGSGMTSYLDSVPSNGSTGGPGMTSYLDNMGSQFESVMPAVPIPEPFVPEAPAAPVTNNGGNYMDNLSASSTAGSPSGAGMTSYLDSVPSNGAVSGAGMTSYLDSVSDGSGPTAGYTPFEPVEPVATVAPVVPAAPAPAPAEPYVPPATPYIPAESNAVASGGNYMENLSASSSSETAPTGPGISTYLDSVPSNGAVYGAGMSSYLDNMGEASDFSYEAPPAPLVNEPAVTEVIAEVIAPEPVQKSEPVYVEPIYNEPVPAPSRNLPGTHWMDTVTPIASYGSRGVINGNWGDSVPDQAANERYLRRASAPAPTPAATVTEQVHSDHYVVQEPIKPATSTQESIAPAVRKQVQTFGGGFVIQ